MTDSAPHRRRVLVATATADEADTFRALLSVWGCEVRATTDGVSALETAATFRPGLALIDLRLNGPDGSELAGKMRSVPGLSAATLVALAADHRPTRADGFDFFLTLPVDPEALRRIAAR